MTSERPKTHQERAESALTLASGAHPRIEAARVDIVARETYPTELVATGHALLEKLKVVEDALQGIYTTAAVHGMRYEGPTYIEERADLRAALALYEPRGEEADRG